MSSVVRYLFIVFVLFNNFKDCLIRCQMNVRYTHATNDCFHLCFGIITCIDECEQGYSRQSPNIGNRYGWEGRRNRNSINNYKSAALSDSKKSSSKSSPKPASNSSTESSGKSSTNSKNKEVSSFRMSAIEQPPHCGLRYRIEREKQPRRTGKMEPMGPIPDIPDMPPIGAFGMGRIVGGEDAEPNEFPWLVSLQIMKDGLPTKHFCGAAIINQYYVLTAAHCTDSLRGKEKQVIIKAGINYPEEEGQVVKSAKFIIHEGWDVERQVNDISLIRLKTPIKYVTNNLGQYIVNALCLPTDSSDPTGKAQLAGWGQLNEDDKNSAEWLQKITLPIWERQRCRVNYREYMSILKTHICAGGRGGEDSCMGDSGGPLMQTRGTRTYVLGVVSFGIPCAVKGLPGVYTYLAYYMDWINNKMI